MAVTAPDVEVAIVGAGFGGLGMAIRLRQAGIESFVVLERASAVGGTWRDNTYPGCACDIPTPLYSFSFEAATDWSRLYPLQSEIQAYLERCADKYGIRSKLRLDTELAEAAFDEAAGLWRLRTRAGETITARFLVHSLGPLSRPAIPDLPGSERFRGARFHSAEWDHGCALEGKDVAVIGTGASAIQLVPEIAPTVRRLALFQRTPGWVLPKLDRPLSDRERWLMAHMPFYARLFRAKIYWQHELRAIGFLGKADWLMRSAEQVGLRHLRRQVASPVLRARLKPNFRIGCKRVLISNDWYRTLCRDNVELVSEPIARLAEDGVVTAAGRLIPADVLIYCTGFRVNDLLTPLKIIGRGGRDLNEAWSGGARAYYGISVAGFPNFFLLVGPNTALGHNSIVFMIEAQIAHILDCLRLLRRRGGGVIEVDPAVEAAFNERVQAKLRHAVWASGCKSWYLDKKGHNHTVWPGYTFRYRQETRHADPDAYRVAAAGAARA